MQVDEENPSLISDAEIATGDSPIIEISDDASNQGAEYSEEVFFGWFLWNPSWAEN